MARFQIVESPVRVDYFGLTSCSPSFGYALVVLHTGTSVVCLAPHVLALTKKCGASYTAISLKEEILQGTVLCRIQVLHPAHAIRNSSTPPEKQKVHTPPDAELYIKFFTIFFRMRWVLGVTLSPSFDYDSLLRYYSLL